MTDLVPFSPQELDASLQDALGQLSTGSKRIYQSDAQVFAIWLIDNHLAPAYLTRSDMIRYRAYLADRYAKSTAKRMLSVARRLLAELVNNNKLMQNPLVGIKGFRVANETPHTALKKQEARDLLEAIDQSTLLGQRDYALVSLLLRTGIRRSECAALNIGDLATELGHHLAIIRHGKGDKRRKAKIPVDVFRSLQIYTEATERQNEPLEAPLFVGFDRWKRPTHRRVSTKLIERVVKHYGEAIGVPTLTPHGLRSTFATLAIEGGATLIQVQYAMGHDDPRTTERYLKRKANLDDNAVDYVKF